MHQRCHRLFAPLASVLLVLCLVLVCSSHTALAAGKRHTTRPNITTYPVGNNSTDATPSIYNFNGTLYVAWTGTDNPSHLNIIQSSDGIHFTNKVTFSDSTLSFDGPQMTAFNGHLYLAWLSSHNDGYVYVGWYNTSTHSSTLNGHTRFQANACSGLGMAVYNGSMYIAYQDCSGNYIDFAQTTDGQNFSIAISTDTTRAAPALIGLNGTIYVAWKGTNNPNSVFLGTYSGSGSTIGPLHVQTKDYTNNDMGMAPYGGYPNLAWQGYTNDSIYTGYYNGPSDENGTYPLANSHSLNLSSFTGPGMCASFGHLYVSWADAASTQLDIAQIE